MDHCRGKDSKILVVALRVVLRKENSTNKPLRPHSRVALQWSPAVDISSLGLSCLELISHGSRPQNPESEIHVMLDTGSNAEPPPRPAGPAKTNESSAQPDIGLIIGVSVAILLGLTFAALLAAFLWWRKRGGKQAAAGTGMTDPGKERDPMAAVRACASCMFYDLGSSCSACCVFAAVGAWRHGT